MTKISTLGPHGSDSFQAALSYEENAEVLLFNHVDDVLSCVERGESDYALIPVYNTREGEIKEYFRIMAELDQNFWVDNIVLPIHLSLGGPNQHISLDEIRFLYGRSSVLNQCDDYISRNMPQATRVSIHDVSGAVEDIISATNSNSVLIDTEEVIASHNLALIDRELAAHNRTRFALIGSTPQPQTGYDATSIITKPLADRVGLLVDTLNEFTKRGINIVDLRSKNDIETQKLQIYLEIEGHRSDPMLAEALDDIAAKIIQEPRCLRILGSFPRVDMRVKKISTFGFIGSGQMSHWFSEQLQSEGYK
ncbi:MAG: prephenate dehydrogenase/arogenate dehydrogenase family protein, partial [Desulfobulbaceae bacterium]